MKRKQGLLTLLSLLIWSSVFVSDFLFAVPFDFNSGSTGVNGAFPPVEVPIGTTEIILDLDNGQITFLPDSTTTVIPNTPAEGFSDGFLNFTTVNLPTNITLRFIKHINNPPIKILATGDVVIEGTIDISGEDGEAFKNVSGGIPSKGGQGGPGGFAGGDSGSPASTDSSGNAGSGPGGGAPGKWPNPITEGGSYGAPDDFVSLIPFFGGSGGGGGATISGLTGGGGGGGGGAILIASSTSITIEGTIRANGGNGPGCSLSVSGNDAGVGGGSGCGGAIRLVGENINGSGALLANAGALEPNHRCSRSGTPGRIRLEAFTSSFNGTISPITTPTVVIGPVSPSSNPALLNLPELRIVSIGGASVPATVIGSRDTPDLTLPQGLTNPLDVVITTNKIPVGATISLRMTPRVGVVTVIITEPTVATANQDEASTTVQVTIPIGEVVILSASVDFTVQTASLYPLIDGKKVERVMVASNLGENSSVTYITESGHHVSEKEMQLRMLFAEN